MQNLSQALLHLKNDPILAQLIDQFGPLTYEPDTDYFLSLVDAIISQQLSVKAAATILARFKNLFPKGEITPQGILELSNDTIRSVGISYGKAGYLKDLATKISDGTLRLDRLDHLSDEEVIEHLIQVKGIGRWSAEMVLMFSLHRPDVISLGDLGLQNAFTKLFKVKRGNFKKILLLSKKWSPYRTVACWYLWKSLDNK